MKMMREKNDQYTKQKSNMQVIIHEKKKTKRINKRETLIIE